MAPPVTQAEKLAIAKKLNVTPAQVVGMGAALGLSPGQVWEWLKKKLKKPGGKIPRPGKGLPSFDVPQWLIIAVVGYILWKWD